MIERHVYLKLTDDHATPEGRQAVREEAERALPTVPGVVSVRTGAAADDHAASAWDVVLIVQLDSIDSYPGYRDDPGHRRFVDDFIAQRTVVRKAWNFEIS